MNALTALGWLADPPLSGWWVSLVVAGLVAAVARAWRRDITDRKAAEARVRHVERLLAQSIDTRRREAAQWALKVQDLVALCPAEPVPSGDRSN
jgi:hypothetical protein